ADAVAEAMALPIEREPAALPARLELRGAERDMVLGAQRRRAGDVAVGEGDAGRIAGRAGPAHDAVLARAGGADHVEQPHAPTIMPEARRSRPAGCILRRRPSRRGRGNPPASP